MNNLFDTNNMGIRNLGSSMHLNNISSNTNTQHRQGTQSHIEMDHTNIHKLGWIKALSLSQWSYRKHLTTNQLPKPSATI